jgi:hypothetical protein
VPRDLDKILARCLRKDPGRRFQHMADLKVALDEVKEESESGKLAPLAPMPRKQNRSAWIVIGSVIVCVVVAGALLIGRRPTVSPAAHPLTRMTSDAGLSFEPALSRDGTLLAFASDRSGEGNLDIWVKQTAGSEPERITRDTVDNHQPSFSPDGSKIAFRSERGRGGIYVVPAQGRGSAQARRRRAQSRLLAGWKLDRLLGQCSDGQAADGHIRHTVRGRRATSNSG